MSPPLALFALVLAGLPAAAAAAAAAPEELDPGQPPWRAIAKVNTNVGTRCSGALVAPDRVLTAAHCLFNRRTGRMLGAGSLHVLFGYDRGAYARHLLVSDYTVPPGYDPTRPAESIAADWAILDLAEPAEGIAPLPLAPAAPPGPAGLAGYRRDKAHALYGDLACAITGSLRGLVVHDCSNIAGLSGGPLLAHDGDGWRVAGVNVAQSGGRALAVPVTAFAPALGR